MSSPAPGLLLDPATLRQAHALNRKLAWAPRFKIRNRVTPRLIQSLLRLSQIGADARLARQGVRVSAALAECDGLRVPLRILRPSGDTAVRGVLLDFHGGGWVIGNAKMNDKLNAAMVAACGVAVVSVDYRLATSTPLQGILDDCLAAARCLLGEGLPESLPESLPELLPEYHGLPLIVVGESAGAHLAAATLLRLKQWPHLLQRVDGALLYYGVYDLGGTASVHAAGPDTLVLDGPGMVTALRLLTPDLSDSERRAAPLSPLYGDLAGLPPALLFAGELDPLRDDSIGLARRWGEVAEVEQHLLPHAPHGFIHLPTRMAAQVLAHSHHWITTRIDLAEKH